VDFPTDSHWATFLTAYSQNMDNSWINEARASLPEDSALDLYRFCQAINPATNASGCSNVGRPGRHRADGRSKPVLHPTARPSAFWQSRLLRGNTTSGTTLSRWRGSANANIANPSAELTTVQLTGDALVAAYFSANRSNYLVISATEGNGSLGHEQPHLGWPRTAHSRLSRRAAIASP